jgi:hypothetical protein
MHRNGFRILGFPGLLVLIATIAWALTPGGVHERGTALRIAVDRTPATAHQVGDIRILAVDEGRHLHAAALFDTGSTTKVDWTARDGGRTTGSADAETAKAIAWRVAWPMAHGGVPVPTPVQIPTPGLSGPSLGLAVVLADVDALTDGDLTGGHVVAATGTVDASGRVSDIGKVDVKARTARDAGVAILLVPADNVVVARAAVAGDDRGMRILAVASVSSAVQDLCRSGGRAVGVCPPEWSE